MKIEGIEGAVKDFNEWQGTAIIYCNTEGWQVWTDVYKSPNSWRDPYYNAAIVELASKATANKSEISKTISMAELEEKILTKVEEEEEEEAHG